MDAASSAAGIAPPARSRRAAPAVSLPPALGADQTYQLWGVVSDAQVISLGILGPNPELETFTVEGEVSALAITIEDAPGVIADGNPDGAFVGTF